MKRISLYVAAVAAVLMFCFMSAASAESLEDCINNLVLPKQRYNIELNQSYEMNNYTDGSINPQTGEFVLRQTDYTLKGRNGLDLELTRIYRSGQVSQYMMYVEKQGGVLVGREDPSWYNTTSMAFYESRYCLGAGWRFSFPTIEVVNSPSDNTTYRYLHTDTGAVYRLLDPVKVDGVDTYKIENHHVDDMVVKAYDDSFPEASEKPQYMLVEKDGKRTYFGGWDDAQGRILGIKDRYGNTIKFEYKGYSYRAEDDPIHEMTYDIRYDLISKITDSVGREIHIDYKMDEECHSSSPDLQHKFDVTVTLPDGQMIVYNKSSMRHSGELGNSTRQRLDGVYTLPDATQYGVNGNYGEMKYQYGYESAPCRFSATDKDEMSSGRGNLWENINFIAFGESNKGKAIEYQYTIKRFGDSGSLESRRGYAVKDLLLNNYTIEIVPYHIYSDGIYNSATYEGTEINADYYNYSVQDPNIINPLYEGFETVKCMDKVIDMSEHNPWTRSTTEGYGSEHSIYNNSTDSRYKTGGKIKVGDFNRYQVDLVAKLREGSTGDGTLKIGFYKEDGTVVYEEVPLVPGEDWKRFSFNPYVKFNYISLEFDPQGDTVYIDDILAGCGYETWVDKVNYTSYSGDYYYYSYRNLLKSTSKSNDATDFYYQNYTYDEREQMKKVVTTISQYYYDIDTGYDSDKSSSYTTEQLYSYDGYGNLLSYSGPEYNGGHVEYTYAPPEKYHTVTSKVEKDADGAVLTRANYTVDDKGNITTEQRQFAEEDDGPAYLHTTYTYDTYGNLLSKARNNYDNGDYTSEYYEYGAIDAEHPDGGLYLTKKYSGSNLCPVWYTYDFDTGLLTSEKMNNGVADIVKSYQYDTKYRLIKMSENRGDTIYRYAPKGWASVQGNVERNQIVEIETPKDHVFYVYDIYGYLLDCRDMETQELRYGYRYDKRHNMIQETDANGKQTTYNYDRLDRLKRKTYPDGSYTNIVYGDKKNRFEMYGAIFNATITNENGAETTYYLDAGERILATETSPDGQSIYAVRSEYDALGRKVKTTDARGSETSFEYDMLGRLTKKTDALGGVASYAYNGNDKVVRKTEPGNKRTEYSYDSAGRLTGEKLYDTADPKRRQVKQTTYNNCNEITDKRIIYITPFWHDGYEDEFYSYDQDITYNYNAQNRVSSKIEEDGGATRTTHYTYDYNGNITYEKMYADANQTGYISKYSTYDNQNRKTWQINSACYDGQACGTQRIAYFYDNMNHVTEMREYKSDPPSDEVEAEYLATRYEYDGRYRLTKKAEPSGVSTLYEYDAVGNVTKQTLSAGNTQYSTTSQYDGLNRLISTTNALNETTRYSYDANGNKTATVDARYVSQPLDAAPSIRTEYDALNRPVKKVLYENGISTVAEAREYDGRGNITKLMNGEGYADGQAGTVMTYDFADNMITLATPEAAAAGKISKRLYYDSLKQKSAETVYKNETDTGAHTSWSYEFGKVSAIYGPGDIREYHRRDRTGQLYEEITDKNGNVTKIYKSLYGTPYKTEYPDGTTETVDYDWYLGLALAVTDRKGRKRKYKYNNAKQVTEESFCYDTDEDGTEYNSVVAYTYDNFGNLLAQRLYQKHGTATEDQKQFTTYTYDALFRVTSLTKESDYGKWYEYDAAGNLVHERQRVSQSEYDKYYYNYDAFGRKTEESVMLEKRKTAHTDSTDTELQTTAYVYDKSGNVKSKTDPLGNMTQYSYDAAGRLIKETSPSGAVTQYSYDYAGNLAQATNAIGGYTKYEYDSLMRVSAKKTNSVNESGGELTWTYGYDAVGNLISEQTPAMVLAGAEADKKTTHTYDNMNRRTATYNADGQLLNAYKYDAADNVIKTADGLHAASAGEVDTAAGVVYTYDVFDRVTSETDAAGNTKHYTYSLRGDLTSETDARGNTTNYTYQYDATYKRITAQYPDGGQVSSLYDNKGRVITKTVKQSNSVTQTETYTYTPFDTVYTVTDAAGNVTTTLCDGTGKPTYVTDARGNETQYKYNADGLIKEVRGPIAVTLYTYDGVGNVVEVLEESGEGAENKVTTYVYLPGGQAASVSINEGRRTEYSYDNAGNLVLQKTLRTVDTYDVTSYTYDIYGRMLTATQQMTLSGAAGTTPAVTSYTYNVMGMKTSETTPRAANAAYDGQYTTSYAYDTVGRLSQVSRKYENGAANQTVTTQYTYDAAGNQVSVTDEAGRETTYTYDSMNRVASVTNALNETTSYSYDLAGNRIQEARPNGTWTYEFDVMNRLSVTKNPDGTVVQKLLYDANGNVIKQIDANGYASGLTDNTRYGTTYTYNEENLVEQITTPEGNTTTYTYTARGDVRSVTDGTGGVTSYIYYTDEVTHVIDPLGNMTQYSYDLAGNRTWVRDPLGNVTTYEYGAFGLLLSMTDPLNRSIAYEYDTEGNLVKTTDKAGRETAYSYDNRGCLTAKSSGGQSVSYSYDTMGNRISMTDSTGTYTYTYDALDRVTTQAKDGSTQVSYGYDTAGNMTQVGYNGMTVAYTYDNQNRMTAVSGGGASASYTYDNNGNVTAVSYGGGTVRETRQYNKDNTVKRIDNITADGNATYQYTYDGAGRVATKTDPYGTTSYNYDAAGRLLKVTMPGAVTDYTYDGVGNRISMTQTSTSAKTYHDVQTNEDIAYNSAVTNYTYNAANELANTDRALYNESVVRLVENTTYSYDPNGNLYSSVVSTMRTGTAEAALELGTADNGLVTMTQNEYDVWNQLVKTSMTKEGQTSEVAYTYNGDGIRTSRTVTAGDTVKTAGYVTSGGMVLAQTGDETAAYVRGLGYVAKIGVSNDVHYYQYNGHGDVVQVASGTSGAVENRYDYDAFGEAILTVEATANEIRYSGEFYDEAAGLYYLRARYYDPVTARFTQEDTYRGDVMDVRSLNLYAYCYNDPVNYVDPSGHIVTEWDRENLTTEQIQGIEYATEMYLSGNEEAGHALAESIRNTARKDYQYGSEEGYTYSVLVDPSTNSDNVRFAVHEGIRSEEDSHYFDLGWVPGTALYTMVDPGYNSNGDRYRRMEGIQAWHVHDALDRGWYMDTDLITMVNPNPENGNWRYRRKEGIMAGDAWYYIDNFGWLIDTDLITMVDPNPDQWNERFTRKEGIMAGDARYYMDERGWVIDTDYYTMVNPKNNYSIEQKIMAGDVHGWLAQGWAMSYDSIPVYSKVQGRSVYVRADQARTYKANDAARYTQIQAEKRAAAQKAAAQKPQGEVYGPQPEQYGPFLEDFKPGGKYYDDSNDTASESYLEWGVIVVAGAAAIKGGAAFVAKIGASLAPAAPYIIEEGKKAHIMLEKHDWYKVVSDPNNWEQINKVIDKVWRKGVESPYGKYDTALKKTLEIKDEIVTITYKLINGVYKISDGWVNR